MTIHQADRLPSDIKGYHQRTKHAPSRYALGPAFLDWTSQPSPYRSFAGSPRIMLPLPDGGDTPSYPGPAPRAAKLDRDALGLFLELAFGLSAWKSVEGSTWALRNNPSSGNLHPTEAWVFLGARDVGADMATLYHYAPLDHALEARASFADADLLPPGGFLLALGSIPWREAWKYGERAFRYCQLDAGHAIGAAAQAAAALGWRAHVLCEPSDDEISALLGLAREDAAHRREREHPELLVWIEVDRSLPAPFDLAWNYRRGARLAWSGEPIERGSRRLAAHRSRVSTLPQAARRGRSQPAAEGVFARRRKRSIHRRGRARATQRATLRRKINASPRRVFLDAGGDDARRGAAARRLPMADGADARLIRPPRRRPGARTLSVGARRSSRRATARGLF